MSLPQPKYAWVAKLVLLAVSCAVAFGATELFLRITGKDLPLMWRPDPYLGWWHIPESSLRWTAEGNGWVEINSLGIRDSERPLVKPAGTFRVAVFGDSMTEGVQVDFEQTFGQLLERRLAERLGRPVEVLNFGVNGYSPLQEYLLYKKQGRAFQPDLVLHAVFLDNDIADLHPDLASGQRGAPFVVDTPTGSLEIDYSAAASSHESYSRQPLATIRRVSAIYRLLSDARWRRLDAAAFQEGKLAAQGVPRRYKLYSDPASAEWAVAWQRLERVLTTFAADVRADGARYAMISVPAGQIVNHEVWDKLLADYPAMSEHQWQREGPERRLASIAARHDIALIAPLATFAQSARRRELFFGGAGHFTPPGHELMASILEEELLTRGLVGDDVEAAARP